eukprot:TRINITY_DN88328_c0_g1_i1.p1 TRINITY_DN88328_c0_g1~~TRINITY_DN88328_c0_g1_i1.p1  ORF type:complete len:1059 (-),score=118.88 TRINITY_DN88328_c0_g1_i1:1723-4899(-)
MHSSCLTRSEMSMLPQQSWSMPRRISQIQCKASRYINSSTSFLLLYQNRQMVEAYMQAEAQKQKANYYNLSYVIEFERILDDFTTAIWKASDAQCSFWTHLLNPTTIDFNALDKDNNQIYKYAKETARLWIDLCNINPNYTTAIIKYTAYLREMRNNDHLANEIQDRAKNESSRKSLSVYVKNNEVLFDDKTAVLHISGAKETLGKILKVNQGVQAVLGYNAIELLQNSISKVMPNIIGRRHNDFMEQHFKTGRNRMFNKERYLFALHKDGYCFHIKLMVKPMPQLENGFIQYVGMIIQTQEEYEYIITDMYGTIDCMSRNLATKLGINGKSLYKSAGVNVQIIAPELIYAYQEDGKKSGKGQKYKEPGGEELILIIPNNFKNLLVERKKAGGKQKLGRTSSGSNDYLTKYNRIFNKRKSGKKDLEITPTQMCHIEEYKNSLMRTKVKCEIQDMRFGLSKLESLARLRVLKISGLKLRKDDVMNPLAEVNLQKEITPEKNEKTEEEQKSEESKKLEEDKKEPQRAEPDPSEFDEEMVVSVKPKKEIPELELISPREPLESARRLLDEPSGALTNRKKMMSEIPEVAEQESPQPDLPAGKSVLMKLAKAESRKESPKRSVDKKDSLLRNTTVLPSIADDADQPLATPHRKPKIMEVYEQGGKIQVPVEHYEENERELAVKRHFLMLQMKEKKAKEKLASGENSPRENETSGEKNEAKGDPELEELAEDPEDDQKEREDDEEGSISSTSTGATIRSYYSIRAAIDERYVPKSIKNMNYMTIFMFVLLLGLAIAYYASEFSLYSSIQDNIKNIQYSEERKNSLIDINLNVKTLVMVSKDNKETNEALSLLDMSSTDKTALAIQSKANLTLSALSLKEAQTKLSLKTSNIGASQLSKINPDNVNILYMPTTNDMPSSYMYTIWQAMLEVVVTSLRISNMTIEAIDDNNPAVYVINKNSLNSILVSLNNATNELVDIIETSRKDNMMVYLILLIVASVAAAVSTLVLIPVINTAKRSKERVLSLFFLLDEAEIKRYQVKCMKFKQSYKDVCSFLPILIVKRQQ